MGTTSMTGCLQNGNWHITITSRELAAADILTELNAMKDVVVSRVNASLGHSGCTLPNIEWD
jgi:hypothetical protein